jgi:uncharacterized protein (DUF2235 family)
MPRNLVLCCDGTNNEFGPRNTNVVRLVQVLDRDSNLQRLYYDPGLGTLPEPGTWTSLGKTISKIYGLAFGAGLAWKVGEAYTYLMNFWEPGDRVFIFGFSRGAYAARVLAGLLHQLGLLPRGNQNLVPYVIRLFKEIRSGDPGSRYWKLCGEFRRTFSRQVPGSKEDRRFPVHFLGLWDTVSSVGWVWDPTSYPFTRHNPSVDVVRHAVSMDERRAFFRQNLMEQDGPQDYQEVWFPGVHCDVGGGYPDTDEEGRLWRMPFEWVLNEAVNAGLLVNPRRLQEILPAPPPSARPWTDRQHESLTPSWWPAEFFPKLVWRPGASIRLPYMNLGRRRVINDGALIHKATLSRIRDMSYNPPNLSAEFLGRVRSLSDVPENLPYVKGDSSPGAPSRSSPRDL